MGCKAFTRKEGIDMTLRYGSVCSGVEAASLAWEPLGFTPQWFSEIERFPCAVLNHHWPNVPNLGDMTDERFISRAGAIDVLVGGTPCQSFSVAGFRGGLDDERGNLALEFCRIAKEKQPRWVVWENVPGCLSTNGGRDFGSIVGALAECGYNLAWRILDAQNWGVPQRRRRVFLVGHLGADERGATAVLFESNSLQGSAKTSREKGQKTAPTVTGGPPYSRTGNERVESDAIVPIVGPVTARKGRNGGVANDDIHAGHLIPVHRLSGTLYARDFKGVPTDSMREDTASAVPVFGCINTREDPITSEDQSLPVGAKDYGHAVYPINTMAALRDQGADQNRQTFGIGADGDPVPTLSKAHSHAIATGMQVRRLTPRECERLQGMPDDHTRIPWRNKSAEDCPDTPRYKAIGNSMAVPVMRWIGERILIVDKILKEQP
jgi:DNA (cytosine-5)-methyltransferase 1